MPSRNPQVRQIEQEADRLSREDGKTSHKERFAIRARLREEAGLGKEQKKRGGVAGAYDRNKKFVLPVAALAAGLIPGLNAAVPAILGGLKGFDREGKGGIGFDVGQGLAGAASGYGLGKVGGAIGNMAGIGGAGAGAVPAAVPATSGASAASALPGAAGAGPAAVPAAAARGGFGGFMDKVGGFAGKVGDFATGAGGKNALGVITAIDAASQRRRADDLTNTAVGRDLNRWTDAAPLRTAGMGALLNPQTPDMGSLGAIAARGNPFATPGAAPAAVPSASPAMPGTPRSAPRAVPAAPRLAKRTF